MSKTRGNRYNHYIRALTKTHVSFGWSDVVEQAFTFFSLAIICFFDDDNNQKGDTKIQQEASFILFSNNNEIVNNHYGG
jgi:hypothetical protein